MPAWFQKCRCNNTPLPSSSNKGSSSVRMLLILLIFLYMPTAQALWHLHFNLICPVDKIIQWNSDLVFLLHSPDSMRLLRVFSCCYFVNQLKFSKPDLPQSINCKWIHIVTCHCIARQQLSKHPTRHAHINWTTGLCKPLLGNSSVNIPRDTQARWSHITKVLSYHVT